MSSFGLYIIGFVLIIAGLAYAAYIAGIAPLYIGIGVLILLGIGITMAVSRTRHRDPSQVD